MSSRLAIVYLALFGCAAMGDSVSVKRASQPAQSRTCKNGAEFIVTLSDDFGAGKADQLVRKMNRKLSQVSKLAGPQNQCRLLRNKVPSKQVNAITACVPADVKVADYFETLKKMKGVESIEENQLVETFAAPWHLDRIDQVSLPLDGVYTAPGTGGGVRVYVVDTGVEAKHTNFEGRVEAGFSSNEEEADVDTLGHGTHCAGIVGSKDYGVAKNATIVPVKVFSASGGGSTTFADIIEGMNWVISDKSSHEGSAVMSMSLGGASSGNEAGEKALTNAKESGVITVVASGNSNTDACSFWPALSKNVITVGSTNKEDERSSFSNYGKCQDIYAPGSDILSTYPGNTESVLSGTSMACPAVSGAVALALENKRDATLEEVREMLVTNALPLKDANPPVLLYVGDEKEGGASPSPSAK